MDETDYKLWDLKVQPSQFSTTSDSKIVSVKKIMDILSDFGTNPDQELLTLSWLGSQSYWNHSIDLQSKSVDWFLYNEEFCRGRGNTRDA